MWKDPIIEEIRLESELYAKQFDFDLDAMFHDLKKREHASRRRLVSLPPKRYVKPKGEAFSHKNIALQHV